MHKLLHRQLKRHLGVESIDALLDMAAQRPDSAPALISSLGTLLHAVEDAYQTYDRNIALGSRSLAISSDELLAANRKIRDESIERQHIIDRLRAIANRVLRTLGRADISPTDNNLDHLSLTLTDLVVEREQTRKELNKALEDFRNEQFALDQHAIVSITDTRGNIQYVNDKFCLISGHAREDIIGRNHRMLGSGYHDAAFYQRMWQTICSGEVWHGEFRNRARKGGYYWLDTTIVPFLDENGKPYQYIAISTNITARKRDEEELRLAAAVFENSVEGIMIADAKGNRVLRMNEAFVELTGYTRKELTGSPLRTLVSEQHEAGFYDRMCEVLAQQGHWQGEVWGQRKSGVSYPGWLSVVAEKDKDGEISHHIVSCWDMSEYKAQDEQIERLAYYDRLTGLPNRSTLALRFDVALSSARRHSGGLALLVIDLDRFKEINDVHGHELGDQVLLKVAARLRSLLDEDDLLVHEGGDEFILLLEGADSAAHAVQVIDAIQQAMLPALVIDQNEFNVSLSLGVSLWPGDGDTLDALLKSADIAMYQAKREPSRHCFYQAEMGRALTERLDIAYALRQALDADALELHFQPFINLHTREVTGAEALLRWHDPKRGWISPATFIPIAEERGIIGHLGEWTLRAVARQVGRWQSQGFALHGRIAVNISMLQFQRPDFVTDIRKILAAENCPNDAIELELTETSVMEYVKQALEHMHEMRAHGFAISIDDFGTGYSSLSYLRQLPVSKLKIDQSFVHNMLVDKNGQSIVQAIISLGNVLGLRVIAEGIETPEQLAELEQMGCLEGQGYYFTRALPADEFAERFLQHAAP